MFYGRTSGGGEYGKSGAQKRNDRYEQMTKQQELIEQKKREIQARLEAERQKKEMEVLVNKKTDGSSKSPGRGVTSSASSATNKQSCKDEDDDDDDDDEDEDDKSLVKEEAKPKIMFSNDGSFLEQFKRMQELQKKQQEEDEAIKEVKVKEEPAEVNEYGTSAKAVIKPLIKIINVPARSASPGQDSSTTGSRNSMTIVPPPNLYNQDSYSQQGSSNNEVEQKFYPRGGYQNVPPPPPPPPPPPAPSKRTPGFPSQVVKELAAQVAEGGDHIEDMARVENQDDPLMWFLFRPDSNEYRKYRELVSEIRIEFENRPGKQPLVHSTDNKRKNDSTSSEDEYRRNTRDEYGGRPNRNRKRRSRWGPEPDSNSGSSFGHPVSHSPPAVNQGSSFRPDGPPPNVTIQGGLVGPGPMVQGIPPPGIAGFPGLTVPPNPGFSQTQFMMNAGVPPPPPPPPAGPGPSSSAPWSAMPGSTVDQKPLLGVNFPPVPPVTLPPKDQPMLIKVTRTNPQLLAYAQQAYGTTNLDEEQWKQCEEAFKMNLLFQDIARKKSKDEKLQQAGKFKHEYDSDEDYEEGTWEHKQRMKEMEKTRDWADDLTSKAKGKHHIGDFLPPDELAKFMEKFKAVKEGRPIDMSDYQDAKLNESNLGFKMLQKMGWTDGQGLGSSGQGITAPIDKGNAVTDKQGLGQDKPGDLNDEDDEYTAYRKRMMLAYRFRPNPLNNPRRAYY